MPTFDELMADYARGRNLDPDPWLCRSCERKILTLCNGWPFECFSCHTSMGPALWRMGHIVLGYDELLQTSPHPRLWQVIPCAKLRRSVLLYRGCPACIDVALVEGLSPATLYPVEVFMPGNQLQLF